MKKINFWLLASLFTAALTLTACGGDDDGPSGNPGGNGGGEEQVDEPALTINDLKGTWKWVNPKNADNNWTLAMGEDNSFSLSYAKSKDATPELWIGTWAEQDGNVVVAINKYSNDKGDQDVEGQYTLTYKKIANGIQFYVNKTLPKSGSRLGGIFVREGVTLDESLLKISDPELVGDWAMYSSHLIINADGTFTYNEDEGRIVELEPLALENGEALKQYVRIAYGSSMSAYIKCYVIKDGTLYVNGWNYGADCKSVEDFINQPGHWGMEKYTKVTE